jgi:hypothetical protein
VQPRSPSHSSRARSFGLRAALARAKLTESTARPLEANDALEGFSPTLHRGGQAIAGEFADLKSPAISAVSKHRPGVERIA